MKTTTYGWNMPIVKLCTQLTTSRTLNHVPTRIELVVCLEGETKPSHGWFISPNHFKSKLEQKVSELSDECFFSKNHLKLVELLRKDFEPHKIQKVEINLMDQKSVYEV